MNSQAANGANHRGSSLVTLSSKRVGPATNPRTLGVPKPPRSHASRSQSVTLLIFRTIGVIIIIISLIWFYLLYRIVSDFGGLKPSSEVVRPPVFNPHDVNRLEWLLKMKLESNAPLLDLELMDSPVLVVTYERSEYLDRALWKLFEHHPAHLVQQGGKIRGQSGNIGRVIGSPIIVSQDGDNAAVRAVVETYRNLFERKLGIPLYHIQHAQAEIYENSYSWNDWEVPYKRLAIHYGWALEHVFSGKAYEVKRRQHTRKIPSPPLPKRAIILEEDIEISRDFFSLMNATADILDKDDTLLAVSAYNDNGNENHVLDHKRLVRSDFFPGLGWMINRQTWEGPPRHLDAALKDHWPSGFWDDWIRESNVRRGRQVLRPEISRSFHFGNVKGASDSESAIRLSKIQLDEINVRWEQQDLSYLDPTVFASQYWNRVSGALQVETDVEAKKLVARRDVRIQYSDWKRFKALARSFSVMEDEKAGIPRTAYEGIIEVRYGAGNYFIYLTPPYLNETKPVDFGTKAWADFSKEALLQRLKIADKTDDFAHDFALW
jgi:alpha-1,3-mannosyl-glycoprotein beta-1,2-N-acetylglucosaminyltransferase